jgi:hypothetical protein
MPRSAETFRHGLKVHMSESGTIMVRDQADTLCRLIGNHFGSSTISGGTAGHAA